MAGKDKDKDKDWVIDRLNQIVDEINSTSRAIDSINEQIAKEGDLHSVLGDLRDVHERKLLRLGRVHDNFCAEYMPKSQRPKKCTPTKEEIIAADTEGDEWKTGEGI